MEKESNVISMKEVKKQTLEEREKDALKEINDIQEKLKKKDYILTVYQIGDEFMSGYDYENQVDTRRFYAVCSLLEIPKYIEYMKNGFWVPREEGLSKKELKNYPYDKMRFGKYWNIIIEPLSKELEDSYIDPKSRKFFQSWRDMRDEVYFDKKEKGTK